MSFLKALDAPGKRGILQKNREWETKAEGSVVKCRGGTGDDDARREFSSSAAAAAPTERKRDAFSRCVCFINFGWLKRESPRFLRLWRIKFC